MFEILEDLEEHKKLSLEDDTRTALTNAQDDIFAAMSDFNNYVNFNLMFYEEQNSAFRILLYIEDILPSYLQKIFQAKTKVERSDIFKNLSGSDGLFDLRFKFNLLSDFFYVNPNHKPDFTKQFLEITNKIFKGESIAYQLLINRFISHLREKFKNKQHTKYDNLKAIMILKFLKNLGLLPRKEELSVANVEVDTEYKKRIQEFLEQHHDVLDSDIKRMVFLEGVLAKKLLNIQQQERSSAPFRARLNSLKLNEKIVKRLYTEIINKLEEYDKNYYHQLEEMIADYILESDFEAVSNDELSFYFVTGMNQAHKFDFKTNNEEE
ncbi:MAG: type I-B CRISPR-associated protein Cas8b/Csh1, partial [Bacillota bacterium]